MMIHLLFVAVGFFCTPQGVCTQQAAQVDSITQCAEMINASRDPVTDSDGNVWYMVRGQCKVLTVENGAITSVSPD
jgi:hypothetical protein